MTSTERIAPADEREIEALIYEVAWLLDSGHADRVHDFFLENAVVAGAGPRDLIGRAAIRAWAQARAASDRTSRHVLSNLRVEKVAEGYARTTSYLSLYRHDGELPGPALPFLVGDSIDDVTKCDDGRWRIAKRLVNAVFVAPAPVPARG